MCAVLYLQFNLGGVMDEDKIRLREEVQEQIRALGELKAMAATYGDDIGRPATNSREAVQVCGFVRVHDIHADLPFMLSLLSACDVFRLYV
jgi:pyruvate-formate lyase